jgi:hypothetical protein
LAVLALAVVMLVHAGLFFIVWLFSQIFRRRTAEPRAASPAAGGSPFAPVIAVPVSSSPPEGNA